MDLGHDLKSGKFKELNNMHLCSKLKWNLLHVNLIAFFNVFLILLFFYKSVKDFCTPFNLKTYKYSQPSFTMELLCSCVIENKNMVQCNVTNHMKEPIMLCPFSKYQNMFGRINTYP